MAQPAPVDLTKSENNNELAALILELLQGLRFGSVEIVVHDGRVVQIDRHEKFRVKTQ